MFDLSQSAANSVFYLANLALLIGAALVLLGAIGALWSSGVRDRYVSESLSQSAADAASANAEAEHARADAAHANLLAEQETVARLRLEARIADRTLTPEQQTRLIDQLSPFRGQTVDGTIHTDSPETVNFANAVVSCIERAGLPMNVARVSGGGTVARGILIGVRDGSPARIDQLAVILTGVLQDAVGSGISRWTYDQMSAPAAAHLTSTAGAEPRGRTPIRIVIGSK